jgi:hypothetical protein
MTPFLRVLALLLLLAPLRAPALSCDGLGAPPTTLVRDMRTSAAGGESLSQLVYSPVLGLFAWTATGMHGAEGQELWVAPGACRVNYTSFFYYYIFVVSTCKVVPRSRPRCTSNFFVPHLEYINNNH